jgi:hypothetical protein
MFRTAALVFAAALAAAPALAQEGPAPAAKAADSGGGSVRVTLVNGRTVDGTLRVEGGWERLDPKTGWTKCSKDEDGASLRLWRGGGVNAYCITLTAKEVKAFEEAPAGSAGPDTGVADAETEKRRSEEAARARKARDARFAAAAAAAKQKADDEAARKQAAEEAERAKADAALLHKFPPPAWSAERIKEIERRQLIMDLMPTPEEREFIAVFPAWSRAVAAAEAKAAAEKKAAEDLKAELERRAAEAKAKAKAKDAKPAEETPPQPAAEPAPEPAKEEPKPAQGDAPAPAPAPATDEPKPADPTPPAPKGDEPRDGGEGK